MATTNVKKKKPRAKKTPAKAAAREKAKSDTTATASATLTKKKKSTTKTKKKAAVKKKQATTKVKKAPHKPRRPNSAAAKKKVASGTTKSPVHKQKVKSAAPPAISPPETPSPADCYGVEAAAVATAASPNDCPPQATADREQHIRELAYLKWEAAGRPPGDGCEFWQAAKQEIDAQR